MAKHMIEKGSKITTNIQFNPNKSVKVEGKVLDKRTLFGRSEALIEISKADTFWVTEEKLKTI